MNRKDKINSEESTNQVQSCETAIFAESKDVEYLNDILNKLQQAQESFENAAKSMNPIENNNEFKMNYE